MSRYDIAIEKHIQNALGVNVYAMTKTDEQYRGTNSEHSEGFGWEDAENENP